MTEPRKAPTSSCVATFRKNGDVYAISHSHKPTGYKAQPAGSKFDGTTAYKTGFCSSTTTAAPSQKALIPYSANCSRNRLPVEFSGDSAKKLMNNNVNPITGKTRDPAARFVTTNQRAFVQHKGTPVGYSNQGIVSEQSKWIHKRQAD